jgi:hypothetical protein
MRTEKKQLERNTSRQFLFCLTTSTGRGAYSEGPSKNPQVFYSSMAMHSNAATELVNDIV